MAKNIVILSDGTGNSAAKLHKTNVWRLYNALDMRDPTRQVVMYDDGVGSQSDPRLAAFTGAAGFGLKQNIIELYSFLCRTYEPGDRIYMFGFSRGGFTVRLLNALCLQRGILKDVGKLSTPALAKLADYEYRQYRKTYNEAWLSWLYGWWFYRKVDPEPARHAPDDLTVRFVGVWDTVDAYGLPLDELADFWNRVVFQMRFGDLDLSAKVERGCQALSIDDERQTFHPLIWNESAEKSAAIGQDIRQAWFAGAHADVGGGYAEPEAALVSLEWMIAQTWTNPWGERELLFLENAVDRLTERATGFGKLHKSRAGLKFFYRYKPRYIDRLTNGDGHPPVRVAVPKIHASVFERIRQGADAYAPIALPETYEIVATGDAPPPPALEDAAGRQARFARQERAREAVKSGRALYVAFVLAFIALAALPWLVEAGPPVGGRYGAVMDVFAGVLPGFARSWIDVFRGAPLIFGGTVFVFVVLFTLRAFSDSRIARLAHETWHSPERPPEDQSAAPTAQ